MPTQLSFLDAPRPATDGVFLALFPPLEPRTAISALGQQQQSEHGLKGKLHAADRFHVSLIGFGEHDGFPQRIVDKARDAAASVAFAPFEISFDRVESFFNKPGSFPRVLRGGGGHLPAFHQALSLAVKKSGLGQWLGPLTAPHVTLMYADRRVESEAIAPIGWTVTEFVLVHSLVGRSQYVSLGRWPLRG